MIVYFYHRETGEFHRKKWSGPRRLVERNTPRDHVAYYGDVDRLSQKIELSSGRLVDYQPERPSEVHDWDASTKRWTLRADVRERQEACAQAQARLATIDRKRVRALAEFAIDPNRVGVDGKTARQRLEEMETAAEAERQILNA